MELVTEFLQTWLPIITGVLMTVIVPIVSVKIFRKILITSVIARLQKLDTKLSENMDAINIADVRTDIKAMRNDIAQIMGKAPKSGGN